MAAAAARLNCPLAAVGAVRIVETGGVSGYLADGSGRPRVLCEAKLFGDDTLHVYDASHPLISIGINNWKLYRGGAAEYGRLEEMAALDRLAALRSTSWGMFQILGRNAFAAGFHGSGGHAGDVEAFVAAMAASEGAQLAAFVSFVEANGLAAPLRNQDWTAFARGYNGPLYGVNNYDGRLAAAFHLQSNPQPSMLRIGCTGGAVPVLQSALGTHGYPVLVDGAFGRVTEIALRQFQSMNGLRPDGVAGPDVFKALGL